MLTRKTTRSVVAVLVIVGLLLVGQSLSQPGQRGQRGGQQDQQGQRGQRGGPGGGQFDPERMRQMMDQRMREQLGATEQEWKVLGPRFTKVQELSRQTRGGGRGGMMFGGRGGMGGRGGGPGGQGGPGGNRPGGNQGAPAREQSAVEKAQEQLRTVLDNTASTPEQITTALTGLRKEREKATQLLAVAEQDLRKIITIRQEAICVMMGILD